MKSASSKSPRSQSRRAARRRAMLKRVTWTLCALFLAGSFAGGFLWRQARSKRVAANPVPAQVSAEQKAEALRLFDEAVRARFEDRMQGAINALTAARRIDSSLKGVDTFIGEIAFEQQDAETVRQAAEQALRWEESRPSAKLLSALEAWMRRGENRAEKAGSPAEGFLAEAAEEQPSNSTVRFFLGEMGRMQGDSAKATGHLAAALHRLVPWGSYDILETKSHLARSEGVRSHAGQTSAPPLPGARTERALALIANPKDPSNFSNLVAVTTALQMRDLLLDPAFADSGPPPESAASVAKATSLPALLPRPD